MILRAFINHLRASRWAIETTQPRIAPWAGVGTARQRELSQSESSGDLDPPVRLRALANNLA